MTPETALKNSIMIDCGKRGWICLHINVGKVLMADGSYFSTGVPVGWLDLLILTDHGITLYVETKIRPNKPSDKQIDMIALLNSKHHKTAVVYDMNEWREFANQVKF